MKTPVQTTEKIRSFTPKDPIFFTLPTDVFKIICGFIEILSNDIRIMNIG